jgi:hypothetical protein
MKTMINIILKSSTVMHKIKSILFLLAFFSLSGCFSGAATLGGFDN